MTIKATTGRVDCADSERVSLHVLNLRLSLSLSAICDPIRSLAGDSDEVPFHLKFEIELEVELEDALGVPLKPELVPVPVVKLEGPSRVRPGGVSVKFVDDWAPEDSVAWLSAWGVSSACLQALHAEGVTGIHLKALYWAACRGEGVVLARTGYCLPAEADLASFCHACDYLSDSSWVHHATWVSYSSSSCQ